MSEKERDELIAALEAKLREMAPKHACLHCGACPHCGRGGYQPVYPVYPIYPSPYYPNPWWARPTITWTVSEYTTYGAPALTSGTSSGAFE